MVRPALFLVALLMVARPAVAGGALPEGFVYLRDVDPSIVQDMRYATSDNFTERRVPGYDAPECVLVKPAAEALKAAQAELKPEGLGLKVYDCYRPAQAVAAFVAWSERPDDPKSKSVHYPELAKSSLFPLGYIARLSGHSRGATMDLTIVPLGEDEPPYAGNPLGACTAPPNQREADASLDMGTGFDCFDLKANTETPGLTAEQRANRAKLVDVMQRHGCINFDKEWWHYTLRDEPYPDTIFDFPIPPRKTAK
jgi:D-alanyl-D-alanine dipeptidase